VRLKIVEHTVITTLLLKVVTAIGLGRFAAAAAVFVPLERIAPHRGIQRIFREAWFTDLLNFLMNGLLFLAIIFAWRRVIPASVLAWMKPLPLNFHGQPAIVQALAVIAVSSFVYYWGHRAMHRFPLLWRFHVVHHSTRQLDWLATYRGHVFETCYFSLLVAVPIALLDLSPPMAMVFVAYRFVESQIEHSNVRLPIGPLKWVVPSPWFHQWHHATDADAQNKNFSPYPIWDVLFGTAFMPAGRLPAGFGVDEPVPMDYLGQVAYPFVR
jgi:sterol desaturase/sphingolipid hydroxylase (fatty acid hydroxylase superfamily)